MITPPTVGRPSLRIITYPLSRGPPIVKYIMRNI